MKILKLISQFNTWSTSLDPHKVSNEVAWYGGIQFHLVMLHMHRIVDFAWDVFTVMFVPLFVWLVLFFFKIWVKYLVAKYLPSLKKYFHYKDETDE